MIFRRMLGNRLVSISIALTSLTLSVFKANASDELKEINRQINTNAREVREKEQLLKNNRLLQGRLKKHEADDPEFQGSCSDTCHHPLCSQSVFSRLGISKSQRRDDSQELCILIYNAANKSLDKIRQLSTSCAEAVKNCSVIKQDLRAKEIENENRELVSTIASLKEESKDLATEKKDLLRVCPTCGFGGAGDFFRPRKPSTGELILGGISALTPTMISGMNLGAYAMQQNTIMGFQNAYTNNYNSYLSQCQQIGVPCNGPQNMMPMLMGMGMGMPMGMGMGMGLMGGYPMGIGMGMGLMGGYPMGIGMGMGMPMGMPMGMGNMIMGGFPAGMGLGIGSFIGMGMPMGMMGMGMPMGMGMYGGYPMGIGMIGMMPMGMGMMGMGMPMGMGMMGYPMGMGMGMPMGMGMMGYPMGMGMGGLGGYPMGMLGGYPMGMLGGYPVGMGMGMGMMGYPMGMGMGVPVGMGMGMGLMGFGTGMGMGMGYGGVPVGMGIGMGMGTGMGLMGFGTGMGYGSYPVGMGMGMGYGTANPYYNPQMMMMGGASMNYNYNQMLGLQSQTDFGIASMQAMQAQQRATQLYYTGGGGVVGGFTYGGFGGSYGGGNF